MRPTVEEIQELGWGGEAAKFACFLGKSLNSVRNKEQRCYQVREKPIV